MGKIRLWECKSCGTEFQLVDRDRYVARDRSRSGLVAAFGDDEPGLYDVFDCPVCGCQNQVSERRRVLSPHEAQDFLPMPSCCCPDLTEELLIPEWPRFGDGSPVLFGDEVLDENGHGFVVHSVHFDDDGGVVLGSGHGYGVRTRGAVTRPTPNQMTVYYAKWPMEREARDD